jgi:folate-binding protein YgfZ
MAARLYLTGRRVLTVGNNPEAFLNGLTSNVMTAPRNAFLNIHGRIIAAFDQARSAGDGSFKLCIEAGFTDAVFGHLEKYSRISGASLKLTGERVYFDLEGTLAPSGGEIAIAQKKGQLVLTTRDLESSVTDDEFVAFCLRHHIPRHGVDFHGEMVLNVDPAEYVCFTKGCYLGQEPVAKVHHRSRPAWRLAVKYEDDCDGEEKAKMTSKSVDPATGKIRGFVFVPNN